MGLLNELGDRLARRVQRGLVRAGLNDIAVLSIDPEQGRALILRHGLSMHRIEIQPYGDSPEPTRSPALGWLPMRVTSSFDDATFWELVDAGVSLLDDRGNAHLVLDGHTAVIGGIFTRNTGRNLDQVPFFGDIPLLGLLFQRRRASDTRGELVIFITPRIVNRAEALGR